MVRSWIAVLLDVVFAAMMYLAMVGGSEGAGNVLVALTVFLFFASFFWVTETAIKSMVVSGRPWGEQLYDHIYDIAAVFIFLWSGWWVCSVLYLFHVMLQEVGWSTAKDRRKKAKKDA